MEKEILQAMGYCSKSIAPSERKVCLTQVRRHRWKQRTPTAPW